MILTTISDDSKKSQYYDDNDCSKSTIGYDNNNDDFSQSNIGHGDDSNDCSQGNIGQDSGSNV